MISTFRNRAILHGIKIFLLKQLINIAHKHDFGSGTGITASAFSQLLGKKIMLQTFFLWGGGVK